ncbi:MAG: YARHG domain-containing protein [Bacteroidales bacterium]|nr:YARHG domain-containing protein [Bacteroidales bacterium]
MSPFSDPVNKAFSPNGEKPKTPLLSQEEIDDEQPPRINITAVICTAIVAVCATIILCVAHPWSNKEEAVIAEVVENDTVVVAQTDVPHKDVKQQEQKQQEVKPQETKPQEVKPQEVKPQETKPQEAKPETTTAGLPIVPVTTTGTTNPYNYIRLIDASSRKLTKAEVAQMTKAELALARNAIYARHGYVYKNAELGEFFAKQTWFKPNKTLKLEDVKPLFTEIEVANINLILAQEKK